MNSPFSALTDFSNKTVLITGSSSGIGHAAALEFAKTNPKLLLLTGRDKERLISVQSECKNLGCNCLSRSADFSKPGEIQELAAWVSEQCSGSLNTFVACHGFPGRELYCIAQGDAVEAFAEVIQVNLFSIVSLTNNLTPIMPPGSSIVYVTSINSDRPAAGSAAYCCSKSALTMFMKCAALDLASKRIRVNSVAPGYVDTNFHSMFFVSHDEQAEAFEKVGSMLPLGHIPTAEGIAKAILFLASDFASDMTGHEQVVDCGQTLLLVSE